MTAVLVILLQQRNNSNCFSYRNVSWSEGITAVLLLLLPLVMILFIAFPVALPVLFSYFPICIHSPTNRFFPPTSTYFRFSYSHHASLSLLLPVDPRETKIYARSPRMRRANWMSLGMMVTRLAWMAQRFVSSNKPTK